MSGKRRGVDLPDDELFPSDCPEPPPLTVAQIAETLLVSLGQDIEPVFDFDGEAIIGFKRVQKRGRGRPARQSTNIVAKGDLSALGLLQKDEELHRAGVTSPQARRESLGYQSLEAYKKARSRALRRFPEYRFNRRGQNRS